MKKSTEHYIEWVKGKSLCTKAPAKAQSAVAFLKRFLCAFVLYGRNLRHLSAFSKAKGTGLYLWINLFSNEIGSLQRNIPVLFGWVGVAFVFQQ